MTLMPNTDIKAYVDSLNYKHVKSSRRRLKERLVEYKGGKCEICGYDKCITALEFHHVDSTKKEFSVCNKIASFDKCKEEVDKCILVCANCHRELHYQEILEREREEQAKSKAVLIEVLNNRDKYNGFKKIKNSSQLLADRDMYKDIDDRVPRKDILSKYHISNRTFNKFLKENGIEYSQRKVVANKPTKDELEELLKTHSRSAIGRMYGVSCNAVRKWIAKYGI